MASKSHSFSIFLLKEGLEAGDALETGNELDHGVPAAGLPIGALLFVRDAEARPPWWKIFFQVDRPLLQATKGAIIFVPVEKRWFALCFGHVSHYLKDEAYEHDFGLQVTLNCADPDQLKNTDVLEPGAARRQRTQVSVNSDLTYFDFDRDSKVLRSLTAVVKPEYAHLVKHVTGSSNLRVTSSAEPEELTALCAEMLDLYSSDDYKTSFPDVGNIVPVKDPAVVSQLDAALLASIRAGSVEASLGVPDLINYSDGLFVQFRGAGASLLYPDVYLELYRNYLQENQFSLAGLTLEDLQRHKMQIVDEGGTIKASFSLYRSLIFDAIVPNDPSTYHLVEGSWYRFDTDYVTAITSFVDARFAELEIRDCEEHLESKFNEKVAESPRFVCLDKTDVSPSGQKQIEPCDLASLEDGVAVLTHVKFSTSADKLSHLFAQGVVSAQALRGEVESRSKLKALVADRAQPGLLDGFADAVDQRRFLVEYAIITHKTAGGKSANLPLFSRINLMRSIKSLELMNVSARFGFIADLAPDEPGLKKQRRPRKKSGPKFI